MTQRFLGEVNGRIMLAIAGSVAVVGLFAFAGTALATTSIESLKLTGSNTITIVYSEPVYTSPGDYSDFTGSFAGESVTSIAGSGTNTITLALSGSVASTATGYVTVGTNVEDVSDQQYFQGATWNILDGIGPAFTSFTMSSSESNGSFSGSGNTLTVSFDTNESVNVLNETIDGHPVSVSGADMGPFTSQYTLQSSDQLQSVPVIVTIADNSNNQTSATFTYAGNGAGGSTSVASGAPVISSITSNANTPGILGDGDSITFTLTPLSPEPGAHITGSYNGVGLSWATSNGGVNYVATYVVAAGQASEPSPLQISGITLTDQYGDISAPASGYDIQKTISPAQAGTTETTTVTSEAAATSSSDIASELQSLESQLASLESQSANTTGFDFTEFLGVGSQNAQVTALQERLTADGFFTGSVTGYFGSLTEAGVEKFQSAHGIDIKGYVGPSTRAALNAGD